MISIELPKDPMGGSEQQYYQVKKLVPDHINLMNNHFDVVADKYNIHWQHQYYDQPSVQALKDKEILDTINCIVFVSHHQKQAFENYLGIPHEKSLVIPNSILPFDDIQKDGDKVNLIYTSTPFRGLSVLVAAINLMLARNKELRPLVTLDVFFDMKLYGKTYENQNANYQGIYDECIRHPNINYHGVVPSMELREYLKKAHIMSYPCIWEETFCISAVEAMAAGVIPVTSDIGALPEICGRYAEYYSPVATDIYNKNRMPEHCEQYSYIFGKCDY